jgi:hypothetical protein
MRVVLLHLNCACMNPFWQDTRVQIPEEFRVGARHWELHCLEEAAAQVSDRPEMWFPSLLFRASNSIDADNKSTVVIKLSGAVSAGKTLLATMALNQFSYRGESFNIGGRPFKWLESFAYVSPDFAKQKPHEEFTDYLSVAVKIQTQPTAAKSLPPTPIRASNLKAAFIDEVPQSAGNHDKDRAREKGLIETSITDVFEFFGSIFTTSDPPVRSVPKDKLPCHTIVFHDTAGEQSQGPGPDFYKADAAVDVVVVVLDATDLGQVALAHDSGSRPENSVDVALERLRFHQSKRRPRYCIVVTKLDLVLQQSTFLAGDDGPRLQDMVNGGRVAALDQRGMLLRWLKESASDPESLLASSIERENIDVFFVWTQDLDSRNKNKMPRAVGLDAWFAWLFNLKAKSKAV